MTTIVSYDRAAILLKAEVTYGTDPVPAGATDSILASNIRVRFGANKLTREQSRGYLGARPFVTTGRQTFIEFDVELLGHATPGTAAPISPVLLACAHAEALTPATDAVYNPISSAFDSVTAYVFVPGGNASGATRHVITGVRGTMVVNEAVNGYARARVTLTGKEAILSNNAFPAQTLTAFQIPPAISADTWAVSVDDGGGAFLVDAVELELDQGQRVQLYETSEQQLATIAAREVTGFLRVMDPALADIDFFTLAKNGTLCEIVSTVTGGAGKNVEIIIPTAQFEYPERIDIDGASGLRVPFSAIPTAAGNDEYSITFT